MNDEQFFLANAYVDGELTDDELRTAESDPEVMSEVESLRALRAELRVVPAASPDAREAAIGAAMAEFRAAGVVSDSEAHEPNVVPLRPRPAYAKFLAVAAALVAVAGLGIVVSQVRSDDDSDDAATADVENSAIAQSSAREEVVGTVAEERASSAGDVMSEAESAPALDDRDAAVEEAAEETAEQTAEAVAGDAEAAPAFEADEAITGVVVPTDFDPEAPILNEVGLAIYGAYLLEQRDLGLLGSSPETRCGDDDAVLDTAIYVLDGDERSVYIAVNEFQGYVLALDTETCAELANGDLF